jgi:hypothetical protein
MAVICADPYLLKFSDEDIHTRDIKKFCQEYMELIEFLDLSNNKLLINRDLFQSISTSEPMIPFNANMQRAIQDENFIKDLNRMTYKLSNGLIEDRDVHNECILSDDEIRNISDSDNVDFLSTLMIGCDIPVYDVQMLDNFFIKSSENIFKDSDSYEFSCNGEKCNKKHVYNCLFLQEVKNKYKRIYAEADLVKKIKSNLLKFSIEAKSDGNHHPFENKVRKFGDIPKAERNLLKALNELANIKLVHVREVTGTIKYPGPCLYGFGERSSYGNGYTKVKCTLSLKNNPKGVVGTMVELDILEEQFISIIGYLDILEQDYINEDFIELLHELAEE